MQDSLHYLPVEKWEDLQEVLKTDYYRNLTGYNVLEIQRSWLYQGISYNFTVYCPYGDLCSGMVAVIEKPGFDEIIIQCPQDNTDILEKALKETKLINWSKMELLHALSYHIKDSFDRVSEQVNVKLKEVVTSLQLVLDKNSPPFNDVSLPPGITFGPLSSEHINIVDSVWPHRYPGSEWFFEKLISAQKGHGLYMDNILIAWAFINDYGAMAHLYVIEEYRRKGYAELISKLLCNMVLEEGRDVFAFIVKTNVRSLNLYEKLGFKNTNELCWRVYEGKK